MSVGSPGADNVVDMTESAAATLPVAEDEKNAIILDPKNSERQYHSDPFTNLQREIWRPGEHFADDATALFAS